MRKTFATILSLTLLSVASLLPTTGSFAPKTTSVLANAQTVATEKHTASAEGFTALSSGKSIYVFNEYDGGFWQEYTHEAPVTQLDFDDRGNLYFLDETTSLYRLNAHALEEGTQAEDVGLLCSTFFLEGDTLYHTRQNWIYHAPLQDLSAEEKLYNPGISSPGLAVWQGDLYYMYGLNYLWKLSLATKQTSEVARLPENTTSITITDGKLFGVTNSNYFYGYSLAELPSPTRTPLIAQTGNFSALSADGASVLLLQGNTPYCYSLTENALTPALGVFERHLAREIPVQNIKTDVETGNAQISIVTTSDNALMIEVDLKTATEYFSGGSAKRYSSLTALKLAESEHYALLSYRASAEDAYKTYLVDKQKIIPLSAEYLPSYDAPKTGYLTSEASLYKFPHLELPTLLEMPKGAKLTLIGEVKGLEREYYAVEYDGKRGYLPKSFVTASDYPPTPSETVVIGDAQAGKDGAWRLAYILLGSAAICILVDFLILRKKSDE